MNNNRRPLKTRELTVSQNLARWISSQAITPNQISVGSLLFASLAGMGFWLLPNSSTMLNWVLPLGIAVCIQGRLLCNLLDGMVAVEGGKQNRTGELFNEIPDRFADSIILVASGYALALGNWGSALGWGAALLAVMTAYIRALGTSVGAPANFQGPMAKPHRMFVLTIACLVTALENFYAVQNYALLIALIIIVLGCVLTLYRRIMQIYHYLECDHDAAG